MIAQLKGPIFGPYYCSNCMMRQPKEFKTNCIFCGDYFSNIESIMLREAIKQKELEGELQNESRVSRTN